VVVPIPADFVMAESVHALMRELTALVYKHGDERTKARASICATYMRCIHDDFYTARDMLLMSHLQARSCSCFSLMSACPIEYLNSNPAAPSTSKHFQAEGRIRGRRLLARLGYP